MHIILAVLGALTAFIWAVTALRNSGFSFDSINPFLMYKRLVWSRKYGKNPLYQLKNPMEVAAVLLLATAKCEGEITTEQKNKILSLFQSEFKLEEKAANDLWISSSFLLKEELYIANKIKHIVELSKNKFTEAQKISVLNMIGELAGFNSSANEAQIKLLEQTRLALAE